MQAVKFEEYERRSSLFSLFMGQRPSEQLYVPVMQDSLLNPTSNRSSNDNY